MMGRYIVLILFAFLVEGVVGDAAEVKSVMEGECVTLNSGVTKGPNDTVLWYFNNTLIAVIDGIYCLYDGVGGMFIDKLMGDRKTGSLIITDIRAAHAGRYEAEIHRSKMSGKTKKVNGDLKCDSTRIISKNGNLGETIKSISLTVSASDSGKNKNEAQIVPQDKQKKTSSGLSPAAVAGICVGVGVVVLLLAAAVVGVVKFTHCSIFDMKKNKQVLKQVSEDESILQAENGKVY